MIQFPDPIVKKENGTYFLHSRDEILWGADRVGIYFSIGEMWTLHRIGPEDEVFTYYSNSVKAYRDRGINDMADQLRFIASNQWDPEDLNRILHITGSIRSILEKQGYVP